LSPLVILLHDWTARLILTVIILSLITAGVVGWYLEQIIIGLFVGAASGILVAIVTVFILEEPVDGPGTYALSVLTIAWVCLVIALLIVGEYLLVAGICFVPLVLFWLVIYASRKQNGEPLE